MSKQSPRTRRIVPDIFQGVFYLSYPLIVYFAYKSLGVRAIAVCLLGLYGISVALHFRDSAALIISHRRGFVNCVRPPPVT